MPQTNSEASNSSFRAPEELEQARKIVAYWLSKHAALDFGQKATLVGMSTALQWVAGNTVN